MRLIREQGALTIRDIDDDVLVDKQHLWASRKPSKRALELGFWPTPEARLGWVNELRKTGTVVDYQTTLRDKSGSLRQAAIATRNFGLSTFTTAL